MARKYEDSHYWITFQLDLQQIDFRVWHLLGEAKAICDFLAGIPLLPEIQEILNKVFLAKGIYATTAIEGNTLTEEEVYQRVEGKLDLPPSKEYLGIEIDNVLKACNWIGFEIMSNNLCELSIETMNKFNGIVLEDLPLDEEVVPGIIRKHSVGVTGARYLGAPVEDLPFLMEKLMEWINSDVWEANINGIGLEIIKAIVAHIYIAWIHPYGDGNGRVARLVELQILFGSGLPHSASHLLSNFYNQTRIEYYRQLDYTSKSGGDLTRFILYSLQGFVDSLREQSLYIQNQQLRVHWINYVHTQYQNLDSLTEKRQRRLLLDITEKIEADPDLTFENPIAINKLRYISPRIAEAYANKTDRTIERDVASIISKGLLKRENKNKVRLRLEIMKAFMNPTRPDGE